MVYIYRNTRDFVDMFNLSKNLKWVSQNKTVTYLIEDAGFVKSKEDNEECGLLRT